MSRVVKRAFSVAFLSIVLIATKAEAHVKWFLGRSESDILKLAKPVLFTEVSLFNIVPITLAFIFVVASTALGKVLANYKITLKLSELADNWEPKINLLMGLCTGGALIYCGASRLLLTPNFIICSHCPWWLAPVEMLAGFSILLGLFSRVGAVVLLALLGFTFVKHSLADCLDLIPLYGLAMYFILSGRNEYSLDRLWMLDHRPDQTLILLGHTCVRWMAGIGLSVLALDEKLLHPQLALYLVDRVPSLNFAAFLHMGNDMFVLCAGLTELVLGLVIALGSFPRLAALGLCTVFASTTFIFGWTELIGHLPYYAIIISLLIRGTVSVPAPMLVHDAMAETLSRTGTLRTKSAA